MYHANLQAKPAAPALRLHRGGVLYRESNMENRFALTQLDAASWMAMLCIFVGWFLTDTLVLSLGPLQHSLRFYDMAAIAANPIQLFSGIDHAHSYVSIAFGLLCLMAVFAPLAPLLWSTRAARLTTLIPLALMVICAVLIAARSPGDYFHAPPQAPSLGSDLIRFANDVIGRGATVVTKRITVGAGAYLALIGSGFLALRGLRGYRAADQRGVAHV
jgi:hypothetical protein